MYSTTGVISVSHGTTMADRPSSSATRGAKANTMMASFSATGESVNTGCPPVSRIDESGDRGTEYEVLKAHVPLAGNQA